MKKLFYSFGPILIAVQMPLSVSAQTVFASGSNEDVRGVIACNALGVAKFTVEKVNSVSEDKGIIDLCKVSVLNDSQRALFKRLINVHGKLAKRLGFIETDTPECTRGQMEIRIEGSPVGPLISNSNIGRPDKKSIITIGMFPDSDLDEFPLATFAHEYGHVFQHYDSPELPKALGTFSENHHLLEAFADIFARDAANLGDSMPNSGIPTQLIPTLRSWSKDQTYKLPADVFGANYDMSQVKKKCTSLQLEKLSEREKSICQALKNIVTTDSGLPSNQSFKDYVASHRGHEIYSDVHKMGAPIVAFFIELEKKSGIPAAEILVQSLKADPKDELLKFSCSVTLSSGVTLQGNGQYVPAEAFFRRIYETLHLKQAKASSNALRKHYSLDAAFQAADDENLRRQKMQIITRSMGTMVESGQLSKDDIAKMIDHRDEYQKMMNCGS